MIYINVDLINLYVVNVFQTLPNDKLLLLTQVIGDKHTDGMVNDDVRV